MRTLIHSLAETEFKTQFSSIPQFIPQTRKENFKIYYKTKSYSYVSNILKGLCDGGLLSFKQFGQLKVYSVTFSQSEAEKLTANIVQSARTDLIRSLAEKECEKQFSVICTAVPRARNRKVKIYYPRNLIENSEFFKSVVSGTAVQLDEFQEFASDFETEDNTVVHNERTGVEG